MRIDFDKKYACIITSEKDDNEQLGLEYYAEHPERGKFEYILVGNDADEILDSAGKAEGLFYQLYSCSDGKRIGYGIFNYDSIKDDISSCNPLFLIKCEATVTSKNNFKMFVPYSLLREYNFTKEEIIVITDEEREDIFKYLKEFLSEEFIEDCYVFRSVKNLMYKGEKGHE